MFAYTTTVKMHDTDAAGVLFFANQFRIAHEAFEAFLRAHGVDLGAIVRDADFALPIVHAEAEYMAPLRLGDVLRVEVRVERVGETSVTMRYQLFSNGDKEAGSAKTVHVAIDKATGSKRSLPATLRQTLGS